MWASVIDVSAAELHGDFAPGGSFTWTSFGFTVTSTLYAVEEARTLWGGSAEGGNTRDESWESTSGCSRRQLPARTNHLKSAAEA